MSAAFIQLWSLIVPAIRYSSSTCSLGSGTILNEVATGDVLFLYVYSESFIAQIVAVNRGGLPTQVETHSIETLEPINLADL